jgi:hypothetical protein
LNGVATIARMDGVATMQRQLDTFGLNVATLLRPSEVQIEARLVDVSSSGAHLVTAQL